MNYIKFSFICLLLCFVTKLHSQVSDIDFVKNKVLGEYPGITQAQKKYINEYVKSADKVIDTFAFISKMLLPFNDRHLMIYDLEYYKRIDSTGVTDNISETKKYFQENSQLHNLEGFWVNDYKTIIIAIVKIGINKFKAVIMKGKGDHKVKAGMTAFFLEKKGNKFTAEYFVPEFGYRIFTYSSIRENQYLTIGNYSKWHKIKTIDTSKINTPISIGIEPTLKILNKDVILISLPDFDRSNKKILDSLITEYHDEIANTKTLLIDIRYNFGGTISVYDTLFQYIYTNPINQVSVKVFCTNNLIEQAYFDLKEKILNKDSLGEQKAKEYYDKFIANKNKYYVEKGDVIKKDKIMPYPQNVGVICNYSCISAAEMLILDFKQSKKVKVFGEVTGGAVDHLDSYSLSTPVNNYYFTMPASSRCIMTNQQTPLDGIGIKPDVIIQNSIEDWIKFVIKYYENQ